jgi:hypothetical protein
MIVFPTLVEKRKNEWHREDEGFARPVSLKGEYKN